MKNDFSSSCTVNVATSKVLLSYQFPKVETPTVHVFKKLS